MYVLLTMQIKNFGDKLTTIYMVACPHSLLTALYLPFCITRNTLPHYAKQLYHFLKIFSNFLQFHR